MTIQEHIEKRLKKPSEYTLSDEEKKIIKFEGIVTYIYRKLTSTKFRKTSVDPESEKQIKNAIHLSVSKNEPIKFTYPFGGYKIWRVSSYPEIDWAEFFTISYVLRYAAQVSAAYKPGAHVSFSSDDVVIELIDNYPRESLDAYVSSFKKLVSEFQKYLPDNFKVDLTQVYPDIYKSKEDYTNELEAIVKDMKQAGLTDERKKRLRTVGFEFNFMRKGKIDYTKLSEEDYEEVIENLMYYSDGYLKLVKRKAFCRGEDKIMLFSNRLPNCIDIGSTGVSKAKFWAGIGVIEKDGERYIERIMSPTQWDSTKDQVKFTEMNVLKGKNFAKIPVFNQRFNFLKK